MVYKEPAKSAWWIYSHYAFAASIYSHGVDAACTASRLHYWSEQGAASTRHSGTLLRSASSNLICFGGLCIRCINRLLLEQAVQLYHQFIAILLNELSLVCERGIFAQPLDER